MNASDDAPENDADDPVDSPYFELTDAYAYSPRLWADCFSIITVDDPSSLARFADVMSEMMRCVTDVHRCLPKLGLTLHRWVELLQEAVEAEYAAAGRRWAGDFRTDEALSSEMRALMVNMVLRGCPRERVAAYLRMPAGAVDHAITMAKLDDDDLAVVGAHLAGHGLAKINHDTGVPRTTIDRIINERLGEKVQTNSREKTAARSAEIRRLRAAGKTNAEIATLMNVSKATVENCFKTARTPMRAADPFQSGKRRRRRRGPAE